MADNVRIAHDTPGTGILARLALMARSSGDWVTRFSKWLLAGFLIAALLGLFLYLEFLGPPKVVCRGEIRDGNRLISEIEAFQRSHSRLPSQLSEVSSRAAEQQLLFYQKCSETKYVIWFGTTLGESITYHSDSRDWVETNGGCE